MHSLRYVVYVTSVVETRIDGGCYIGEGRWERNVLDALVRDGREVYVPNLAHTWRSPLEIPANLHDYSELNTLDNLVFISHSPPMRLDIPVKAHRYILQWFNGPDDDADKEFLSLVRENPNSVVATYNFAIKSTKYKMFGVDNIEWVQGPAVPRVYREANNFLAPYLLWSSKSLYYWAEDTSQQASLSRIFDWCSSALSYDSSLSLVFLLGTAGPLRTAEEIQEWFWKNKSSGPLRNQKEQVVFLSQVEWFEVSSVLEKSRLIVSPHYGYGGPPYESASFGIPMILSSDGHPFMGEDGSKLFPEVMSTRDRYGGSEFVDSLNKLLKDRALYERVGGAYRDYTDKFATYKAYLEQIDAVSKKRGWA